jgi:hypothetical protein
MNGLTLKCAARLVLALSLLSLSLRAQDEDDHAAKTKVLALEHVWNQAEAFRDLKALDVIFDSTLIYVDSDGRLLTKAEFLAQAKQSHLQQVITDSMTVQMYAGTAIVTGTYHAIEIVHGKPVMHRGRFVDTWISKDGTWVCVAAEATPVLR